MKLALISEHLTGQGSEYVTAMTARAFAVRGWDVDVLLSQVHVDYVQQGRKAFDLPPRAKIVYMPNRRGSRNGVFLRHYLKTGGADLVIAESDIYSWCLVWASLGLSRKRLPKLAQVNHGNADVLAGRALWRARIRNWFHYRKFHALMFVNQRSADNFRSMFGFLKQLRVGCVNNACVDEVFRKKVTLPAQHPWLLDKRCTTFVTAGSYTEGKCHLMVMEAFRQAAQQRRVRLIVFGRGRLEAQYRAFIAQHHLEDVISIGGFTDQLPAEVAAADCLISSSDSESFGITIVEALACHKSVISTDAPYGPCEILAEGKYGRLVPVMNVAAMAQAVIAMADGKIPAAPDESWQRYTVERVNRRYFDLLGI